ncbi:hypothetical protein GCM10007967_04260 [Xylanimonas ulmi]
MLTTTTGDLDLRIPKLRTVVLPVAALGTGKGGQIVSQAVVTATGARADERRAVLGFDVDDSEDGTFWTAFQRRLRPAAWAGSSSSSPTRAPAQDRPRVRAHRLRPPPTGTATCPTGPLSRPARSGW